MFEILIFGIGMGLSLGTVCFMECTPIYLPYLVSDKQSIRRSFRKILEISAGRFIAYSIFGLLAGYAGQFVQATLRSWLSYTAFILVAGYLLTSSWRSHRDEKKCHIPKIAMLTKSAFILGLITGFNICGQFVALITQAFEYGSALKGGFLFLGFFFGSTVFLIPLGFAGAFSQIKLLKKIARYATVLIALIFLYKGVNGIYYNLSHPQAQEKTAKIIEIFNPSNELAIISSKEHLGYFAALRDSIAVRYRLNVKVFTETNYRASDNFVLFIDSEIIQSLKEEIKPNHKIEVEDNYSIPLILNHLEQYAFQYESPLHRKYLSEREL